MKIITIFLSLLLVGCADNAQRVSVEERKIVTRSAIPSLENIIVMLPIQSGGDLGKTSQAIYNGVLAAHYSQGKENNIKIKLVDTTNAASNDILALYNKAVLDGADLIIGPLTKVEVEAIAREKHLPVPTIALNTLDNYQHKVINNLYQFGLLPQDEALQAAMWMTQKNLNRAAVVVPQGSWGDRISTIFERQYILSGGKVVDTLIYGGKEDQKISDQVCDFLTPKRLGEVKRRQDIDSIFVVAATQAQAKQIISLLKFYYANDLPIYSLSTIYNGTIKNDLGLDLNDVYFFDSAWVLGSVNSMSPKLQSVYNKILATSIWKDSFADYSKFYALGVDAYNLAVHLNDFLSAPQVGFDGASGVLYLDNFNHIYRQLHCAQIKNEKPH